MTINAVVSAVVMPLKKYAINLYKLIGIDEEKSNKYTVLMHDVKAAKNLHSLKE